MKIKEQTRKLAAGCSKHCFEVVDKTDGVSSKHCFEVMDRTDEVSSKYYFEVAYIYGKAKLTWFEEIFEEYQVALCKCPLCSLKGSSGMTILLGISWCFINY